MGGDAFRSDNHITTRITKEKEISLLNIIIPGLKEIYTHVHPVIQILEKKDSGDLDIIVLHPKEEYKHYETRKEAIFKLFNCNIQPKGNLTKSYLYFEEIKEENKEEIHKYQIDLRETDQEHFDLVYYTHLHNDLPGIISQMFCYFTTYFLRLNTTFFNLHFGEHGLYLKIYFKDGLLSLVETSDCVEILLSKDMHNILHFLNLNFDTYKKQFDTYLSSFKYVTSSCFFNKNMFLKIVKNSDVKRRETKRLMYKMFLEYLEEEEEEDFKEQEEKEILSLSLNDILIYFKIKDKDFKEVLNKKKLEFSRKHFLNTQVIMDVSKLTGPTLGKFRSFLQNEVTLKLEEDTIITNEVILEKLKLFKF
jgi:hypothetical protein